MTNKIEIQKKTLWMGMTLLVILIVGFLVSNTFNSEQQKTREDVGSENLPILRNDEILPGLGASLASIPLAKSSTIVDVADGETYLISADIVKKEINGQELIMYGYNGMIPGVALRVQQGSKIKVIFKNNIDMNTTVHWHGLRHNVKDDGVPDVSQDPVKPGESFTYELYFPDDGIFWYHPHIREDIQQDAGLAGNMLVVPKVAYNSVNREELLVLDDILLDSKGQIVPFGKERANFAVMGRFGNIMLTNGKTYYDLTVDKGEVVRYYITNVANVRPFNFSISGAKMKLVGGDLGQFEREEFVDSVIIAPAVRYIVDVYFEEEGRYDLMNINPVESYVLGSVKVTKYVAEISYSDSFFNDRVNQKIIEEIAEFEKYFNKPVDYELNLDVDLGSFVESMAEFPCHVMGGIVMGRCTVEEREKLTGEAEQDENIEWEDDMNMPAFSEGVKWIIEEKSTEKQNMDIGMKANVGDIIKIRLFNNPESDHPMQHPIHLHGQRFIVTAINGKPVSNKVWSDTILVPIGSTVDILVDVTNPGEWMMHCHIAEHLEAGMMTSLTVGGENESHI